MKDVGAELRGLQEEVCAPATDRCLRCCTPLFGELSVVVADADQAFEACCAEDIAGLWRDAEAAYRARGASNAILVRKGPQERVQVAEQGFSNGWWHLPLSVLARALIAFTLMTVVLAVGRLYVLQGICIGGVMSSAAVAVSLGGQEHRWFDLGGHRRLGFPLGPGPVRTYISWRRYVDDCIAISKCFCSECVLVFLQGAFSLTISPVALSGPQRGVEGARKVGVWLDVEI